MLHMFRVLNEYDVLVDPLSNGIASKKLIYELTEDYLMHYHKDYMDKLDKKDRDSYIRENMIGYLTSHKHKLEKRFIKKSRHISEVIDSAVNRGTSDAYVEFKMLISTLNNHLINGSRLDTDWISATRSLEASKRYYDRQDIHQIAFMKSDTVNGIYDDNTFVVDLGSHEQIERISRILCAKVDLDEAKKFMELCKYVPALGNVFISEMEKRTSPKFTGYNYSVNSREVCVLRYVRREDIINVLGALEIDMMRYGILDFNAFINMSGEEQIKWLKAFKSKLEMLISLRGDAYLRHIYQELYVENKNIKLLDDDANKVKYSCGKILRMASSIPDDKLTRK